MFSLEKFIGIPTYTTTTGPTVNSGNFNPRLKKEAKNSNAVITLFEIVLLNTFSLKEKTETTSYINFVRN